MLKPAVDKALADLRAQFAGHTINVEEDGGGGAYFVIEGLDVGPGFTPSVSWLGGHLSAALPYADVYPLFIDGALRRAGGKQFAVPILPVPWRGRAALQVSRINRNAASAPQSVTFKVARVLEFIRGYQ